MKINSSVTVNITITGSSQAIRIGKAFSDTLLIFLKVQNCLIPVKK